MTPHNGSMKKKTCFTTNWLKWWIFFWSKRIIGPHDYPILYELTHRSRSIRRLDGNKDFDNPPLLTCIVDNRSQAKKILLNQNLKKKIMMNPKSNSLKTKKSSQQIVTVQQFMRFSDWAYCEVWTFFTWRRQNETQDCNKNIKGDPVREGVNGKKRFLSGIARIT